MIEGSILVLNLKQDRVSEAIGILNFLRAPFHSERGNHSMGEQVVVIVNLFT